MIPLASLVVAFTLSAAVTATGSAHHRAALLTPTSPPQAPVRERVQGAFVPLRLDGNGIPQLTRTLVAGDVRQPLGDALRSVARLAGVDFSAAGDLPGLDHPVRPDGAARPVSVILLRLVEGTGIELLVSPDGPTIVARREERARGRSVMGRVRDSTTGEAIGDALVELTAVDGASGRTTTAADGRFHLRVPAGDRAGSGPVVLQVRRLGYASRSFALAPDGEVAITLSRLALPLSAVVVTPGYYGMMATRGGTPLTLTREQIRSRPQIGEDLFRSVTRLPGVAASDFSAAFRVRGGANRELYATLDGLELVEPFHLKDFDGALSIIDVGAISGLDLITGGFGAQYGNRLTGIMAMRTIDPAPSAATRTEVALTLTTLRATSHGTFAGDRGGWLVSARRGFLEYALRAAGEDDDLRPRYADVLAKATYRLSGRTQLSLHALRAGDRLTYQNDIEKPRIESRYGSTYVWSVLRGTLPRGLSYEGLLSYGLLDWHRDGTRTSMFDGTVDLSVRDDRVLEVLTARQDWQWEASPALVLAWGGELRRLAASHDYARAERRLGLAGGRVVPVPTSLVVRAEPAGSTIGGYASLKVRPIPRATVEAGARIDHQTYTDERQAMPRLALALDLAPRTTARVGWGRYAQPQGLHELQSTDGVSQIGRAEVAEQRVMGLHHRSREAITTRVELYERRLLRVAPRWVSVDNSIDVFPEIEPGRVLLTPSSGRARGVEVMASRPEGQRITWSASYALARADDRVDGRIVRRPLDQRHTVALDAGWRPTASWQVSAAWLFHSGWPTTAFAFTFDTLRNGMVFTDRVFGARNVAELPAYHRLDLRASRTITRGATRVALFVDLFNAYDRRNARGYDVAITRDGPEARFGQRVDALIPRLPSFGVSWEF